MNRRNAFIYFLLVLTLMMIHFQTQALVANATMMNRSVEIPDDSIRLRILANSNSQQDQSVKRLIRNEVNAEITQWVGTLTSIDLQQARGIIKQRLPEIKDIVAQQLQKQGINDSFSVKLQSVAFPTKMYGEFIYPAGKYESVLITIGDGLGDNWWCVLFPPLCFLDFENGDAVKSESQEPTTSDSGQIQLVSADQESEEIEVKFFLIEWIDRLIELIKDVFSKLF
jgi:stage II sporulation protein R